MSEPRDQFAATPEREPLPSQLTEPPQTPTLNTPPAVSGNVSLLPARPTFLEIGEEIAHGGMGAVYRARDTVLGRELAVKVLLDRHADRPDVWRRFAEEARVAGQLQHPGVPPVYEVGLLPDGRPFIAMKLIQGRTLAALLAERASLGHDLPRFLGIFEQVCQTVAYAHSRGVIHRDLKPLNVMVGAFGEVQVMDWGLAKALASRGHQPPEESAGQTSPPADAPGSPGADALGSPGTVTGAGSILGTPAYMAPEQARGEIGCLDERADVFGLGAILCNILTGQSPFHGPDPLERAARGDLADTLARLDLCGADPELVELARSCLAVEVSQRPRDASAVAEAVSQYLASVQQRLREAERERAAAQVRARAERTRRRLTAALAAAVLGLAAVGGVGAWWYQQQRGERAARLERTRGEVKQARDWLRQGRYLEAEAVLAQAAQRLGPDAPNDLRLQVEQARADRKLAVGLEDIRLDSSVIIKGKFRGNTAAADYANAFAGAGLRLETQEPVAVAKRIRASDIRDALVAALDDWILVVRDDGLRERLLRTARLADPDPWRDRWRDPKWWNDRSALQRLPDEGPLNPRQQRALKDFRRALQRLADEAPLERLSPHALASFGELLWDSYGDARPLLRKALQRHPSDFWLNFRLGSDLVERRKDTGQAVGYLQAALALRPRAAGVHVNLAIALDYQGRREEAEAGFRKAIALDPRLTNTYGNLAGLLMAQNRGAEALALVRRLVSTAPDNPRAHRILAEVLTEQGKTAQAVTHLEKAVRLDPRSGAAHSGLGELYKRQGRLDEALAHHRKAVRLAPGSAVSHYNLGVTLLARKDLARKDLDQAIAAFREALRRDPKLIGAHANAGIAFYEQGKPARAELFFREELKLVPDRPTNYFNLGNALAMQGKNQEAAAAYEKALQLSPNADKAGPTRETDRITLGLSLHKLGRHDEALAAFEEAVRLEPGSDVAHFYHGVALTRKGRLQEAAEALRKAVRLDPRDTTSLINLGEVLSRLGQLDEADKVVWQVIRLNPKNAMAHYNLGCIRAKKEQHEGAIVAYRNALELRPDYPEATCNLGLAYMHLGKFTTALAWLKRGHELGEKTPGWKNPSGQWVRECERRLRLDDKLAAVLRGEVKPQDAAERLALASLCQQPFQQRYAAAARLAAEAFAAEPRWAESLRDGYRYDAACAAARAGCGQGKDAGKLDERERSRLRQQARDWLRAELALWARASRDGDPAASRAARAALTRWRQGSDLAGVRTEQALRTFEAAERQEWEQFWADVDGLLKTVAAGGK
jgi:serine/threonine-protein kinase